ncbi:MAG TPA: uroporphyrinogen-III synthase [Gaiellaceae bacterium]
MRVIVTRPRDQAGPLVARIEALGHEVVACPLIEIEPIDDGPVDTTGYDWLVVTSPNGAAELSRRRVGALPRVAAIGPGTAEALRAHDIEPELVAGDSRQEGLVDAFPANPRRVLFAGAEGSRRHLIDALRADFRPLYRTILVRPEPPPEGDLVVLASGSAARSFAALGLDLPVVSIGPQTTRAAERAGLRVVAEAATHDLDGLVEAVRLAACSSPS